MRENSMYEWRNEQISLLANQKVSRIFNFNFDVMYGPYGSAFNGNNQKFVIFGIPRSGNTWLQTMLSIILQLPVIDPWVEEKKPGVGMCHRPLEHDVFKRTDFSHGLCLVRDIRDIAASYYKYVNTDAWSRKSPWFTTKSMDSFFYDYFFPRMDTFYDLANYWNKYSAFNLPIVRYENMVNDPRSTLLELALQIGIKFEEEKIDAAISKTEISKLRKEGVMGYEYVSGGHFGKGVAGSYREILPVSIIREIERRYGPTLTSWGYSL